MSNMQSAIIRLTMTHEVRRALDTAKKKYPTLSDPEILKLGLSKIVTEDSIVSEERDNIRHSASQAVGSDYLRDRGEDLYSVDMGEKVHFS